MKGVREKRVVKVISESKFRLMIEVVRENETGILLKREEKMVRDIRRKIREDSPLKGRRREGRKGKESQGSQNRL